VFQDAIIATLTSVSSLFKMSLSDQVQEDKSGGACGTHRDKTRVQHFGGKNMKKRNHLEYLGETWLMLMRWEGWLIEGFVNTGTNFRVRQDVGIS
jgi:hypothetical protein